MSQTQPTSKTNVNHQLSLEASERLNHLEAVNKISAALRVADTVDEMLTLLANETQAVTDAAAVTVWMYDAAHDELRQAAATGFPSLTVRIKPGQGISGQVFVEGQAYISHEFKTDPRTEEAARAQVPAGLAGAAIPIRTAQETVGVLFASVLLPREFNEDQVRLLTTIAEIAGIAIHRMRLHELTERRLQRLMALQTINLAITASLDLQITLAILLDQVMTQLQADAADILLFDPESQLLNVSAARGFQSKGVQRSHRLGEALAGKAAVQRQAIVLVEPDAATRTELIPQFDDDQFVSCSAVPLLSRGQIRGVLEIFQRTEHTPDQEWLDFLQTLAESATIAINNAAQFENLGRSNTELITALDFTIESWAVALDRREQEPDGHARRVADMTVRLSRTLGMKDTELLDVRRGALLHDIGKLGVPETILLKEGPLTEKEWAIIRRHTTYAYELLSSIPYMKTAITIPYCHHERWDGTGYPNGLKNDAIPLEARIFAVVDVWDALCADRPYRPAWPEVKVLERLRALSGTHLDPKVVDAFLQMLAGNR